MFLSIVPFLYSKRTAAARSLVSRYRKANVLSPLRSDQPWTYPTALQDSIAIQLYSAIHYTTSTTPLLTYVICLLVQAECHL